MNIKKVISTKTDTITCLHQSYVAIRVHLVSNGYFKRFLFFCCLLQVATRDAASAVQLKHIESLIRARPTFNQNECSELIDHLQHDSDVFTFEQRQSIVLVQLFVCEGGCQNRRNSGPGWTQNCRKSDPKSSKI